jgi:hypothetical protein
MESRWGDDYGQPRASFLPLLRSPPPRFAYPDVPSVIRSRPVLQQWRKSVEMPAIQRMIEPRINNLQNSETRFALHQARNKFRYSEATIITRDTA